jgi:hypothetical protein
VRPLSVMKSSYRFWVVKLGERVQTHRMDQRGRVTQRLRRPPSPFGLRVVVDRP